LTIPASVESDTYPSTAIMPAETGVVSDYNQLYVAISVAERFGMNVNRFMASDQAGNPPSCSDVLAGDSYCAINRHNPLSGMAGSTSTSTSSTGTILTLARHSTETTSLSTDTNALTTTAALPNKPLSTLSGSEAQKVHTEESPTGTGWPSQSHPSIGHPSSSTTATSLDTYKMYTGGGSTTDNWPTQSDWVDFGHM